MLGDATCSLCVRSGVDLRRFHEVEILDGKAQPTWKFVDGHIAGV
jgi:hypothetical protein